jgi:pimeloyl-ACP methyl ester carboxylesterase
MRRASVLLAVSLLWSSACAEPAPIEATPAGPRVALDAGVVRDDLRFPCGDTECAAWLFLPPAEKPPVVVMAHGFAGTRDVALPAFAERFAAAGVASLVFDYRHFGASGGAPRQLVDPWTQAEDWKTALAFARSLHAVDGSRVALFGTSLGAGHALATAAGDANVRAVVAQVPLIDSSLEGESTFYGVPWVVRLLLTAWADLVKEHTVGTAIEVPAIVPAGGFGMIVDDSAYAAFEKLVTPGSTYRNAVAAHSVFTFDDWNPAPAAATIQAPILVVASRRDRFAPFAAVEALAAQAPHVTVAEIDGDHFDVYSPPLLDEAAAIEARYLAEHLRATPGSAP